MGRIHDWHKKHGNGDFTKDNDPGVISVKTIYQSFRKLKFSTKVMAASFRSVDQILELAGVDLLTISPQLLQELTDCTRQIESKISAPRLDPENLADSVTKEEFDEAFQKDRCARELLSEGILKFEKDARELESILEAF